MKIEVDVKRAEQSWELDSGEQLNFLVVDVLGLEVRVPCSAEQLTTVLAELHANEPEEEDADDGEYEGSQEPVAVRSTFQAEEQAGEEPHAPPIAAPSRTLQPLQRRRGDDVGIVQG